MPRRPFPPDVEARILTKAKRRCAFCFGLRGDFAEKKGQIAHIDQDPENNDEGNGAFLCFIHHDEYDSTTSQSKGLTQEELKIYQQELWAYLEAMPFGSGRRRVKTTRQATRVSLDVYDRRVPVYRAARQFVRDVMKDLNPDVHVVLKFASDTDEALFLFDDRIADYLTSLFKKAMRLRTLELLRVQAAHNVGEAERFSQLVKEMTDLTVWFSEQPDEIRARFEPFLRLGGK